MTKDTEPAKETRAATGKTCAPDFVYTIFIRADRETVWNALMDDESTQRYWGHNNVSTWEVGALWKHVRTDKDKTVDIVGRVIAMEPPTKMVWSWASQQDAANPEKSSRVTYELVALGPDTKLTVTHSELEPESVMDKGIHEGWPAVVSNLKTLLETGEVLREQDWPTQ